MNRKPIKIEPGNTQWFMHGPVAVRVLGIGCIRSKKLYRGTHYFIQTAKNPKDESVGFIVACCDWCSRRLFVMMGDEPTFYLAEEMAMYCKEAAKFSFCGTDEYLMIPSTPFQGGIRLTEGDVATILKKIEEWINKS